MKELGDEEGSRSLDGCGRGEGSREGVDIERVGEDLGEDVLRELWEGHSKRGRRGPRRR